jgi:hypothetical protein
MIATRVVTVAAGAAFVCMGCAAEPAGGPAGAPTDTIAVATPPRTVAPPGYRQVDFHGLAIDVPSNWPLNARRCGQPVRDTVMLPGPVPACAGPRPASVTSVEFVEDQLAGLRGTLTGVKASTFSLDGERAIRLTGRRDRTFVVSVTVPAASAQVVITSPRRTLARSLAAALTITEVDSNGCPAHAANTSVVPTGTRPSRPGAADALLPATPSQITVCRYLATLIEQSTSLDAAQRASFVAALNDLPQGLSRTDTDTYLPELCRTPPTSAGSFSELDASDSEAYLVIAKYDTGPNVTVIARLNLCGDLGASNGTRTGQRIDSLVDQLISAAGNSQGWSGAIHPGR